MEVNSLERQWEFYARWIVELEKGHDSLFLISVGVLSLWTMFGNNSKELMNRIVIYALIPLAVTAVLFYTKYKLRRVAILKGYLCKIEKELERNKRKRGNNLDHYCGFSWFLGYENVYISKNNFANRFIVIIVGIILFMIEIYCINELYNLVNCLDISILVYYILMALVFVFSAIILWLNVAVFLDIKSNERYYCAVIASDESTILLAAKKYNKREFKDYHFKFANPPKFTKGK